MSSDDASGLAAIDPQGRPPVLFGGERVQVKPLTVGQLPAFARAIKPIFGTLEEAFTTGSLSAGLILDLAADHGEQVVEAISVATAVPVEKINQATPDELLMLVVEVMSINRDFLLRRLNPAIQSAAVAAFGSGQTASSP